MTEVELEGETIVIRPKKLVERRAVTHLKETLPKRLTNPRYGEEALERELHKRAIDAPSLAQVRKITANVPSLSGLIAEDWDTV